MRDLMKSPRPTLRIIPSRIWSSTLVLCLLAAHGLCTIYVSAQTTGNYPFQTVTAGKYDRLNLGDLSLLIEFPVRNKQGPIQFSTSARQSVYISKGNCTLGNCTAILQGQTFGIESPFASGILGLAGLAGAQVNIPGGDDGQVCQNDSSLESWTYNSNGTTKNPGLASVTLADGGTHSAPANISQSVGINSCPGSPTSAAFVTADGSGYTVYFSFQLPITKYPVLNVAVFDKSGSSLSTGAVGIGGTTTDRNGNTISSTATSVTRSPANCGIIQFPCTETFTFDDSLGADSLVSVDVVSKTSLNPYQPCQSQSTVCVNYIAGTGTIDLPSSFSYNDASANQVSYEITYSPFHFATAFGCGGQLRDATGKDIVSLPTKVAFPDGSALMLGYEQTSGYGSGYSTGRLSSITLPTGGSITYSYSGGTSGINCNDATPVVIQRTTLDGTWTYSRVESGTLCPSNCNYATTTVSDPYSNSTVNFFMRFGNGWLPLQKQEYDSGSHLLRTTITCYNGQTNLSECATGTNFPFVDAAGDPLITERTVYVELPDANGLVSETDIQYSNKQTSVYLNYGLVTEEDTYDWNKGEPGKLLTRKSTTYGSWNGSTCAPVGNYIYSLPCDVTESDGTNVSTHIRYTRDSHGNATTTAQWTGTSWLSSSATYNANGTVAVATDLNGAESSFSYTGCNAFFATERSQVVTSQDTLTKQDSWDCHGAVKVSETDANGNITQHSFTQGGADPFWREKAITDPLQNVTEKSYANFISGVTNPYTAESMTFNGGSSIAGSLSYLDGFGRVLQSQRPQNTSTNTSYDTVSVTYDGRGRPYSKSEPCTASANTNCTTAQTIQTYEALNRPWVTTDASGGTVTKTYSNNDMLEVVGPAPSGEHNKVRQYEYDALGRLTSVCEILSSGGSNCGQNTSASGQLTTYVYTVPSSGGKQMVVTQSGQARTYVWDGLGRLVSETNPESGTTTYTYDSIAKNYCVSTSAYSSAGDLVAQADANGNHICYYYDNLHRLTDVAYRGPNTGYCKRFRYDNTTGVLGSIPSGVSLANTLGRTAEAETDNCTSPITQSSIITDEWFSYDEDGRKTDIWELTPHSGQYYHSRATFYANGQINTVQLVSPSLYEMTYSVDGEGRWNTLTDTTTGQALVRGPTGSNIMYNASGQPVEIDLTGTDKDLYSYDGAGRMHTFTFQVGNIPKTLAGTLGWNTNGTLQSLAIVDGFNVGGSQICNFNSEAAAGTGYDDLGRLIGVDCGTGQWGQTYSYDAFGNLTKTKMSGRIGTTWNPGYSAVNNHCSICGFDADGNVTSDGNANYGWDVYSKLAWTATSGTPTCGTTGMCAVYDAFGKMVEQSVNSTWSPRWITQLGFTAIMTGASPAYAYWPAPGGGQVLIYGNSANYDYLHRDWLGNVRIDSSLTSNMVTTDQAYSPYGELYDIFGSSITQNKIFSGMTGDFAPGTPTPLMWDTPNRELSVASRWLSPDPAGFKSVNTSDPQSWNRYTYVTGDPLSRTDPEGLCPGNDCAPDAPQGGGGAGGGWVSEIGSLDFIGFGVNGAPFGQGLAFEIDGFAASNDEALAMLNAEAGDPKSIARVTVPENVIFDEDANGGNGLTCEQACKFKDMQKQMEAFYAKIGIQFTATYTNGQVIYNMSGGIIDITKLRKGTLNVFVFGNSLAGELRGATAQGTGASSVSKVQNVRYALTFIGLPGADGYTLEHEFAHHFIGNTFGAGTWFQRYFIETYIDHTVLPNLENYGETMRHYAQQIP